jgi:predicted ABC-type transport system involved in lysophospholipase L1 biosynthesis ATPase subunit
VTHDEKLAGACDRIIRMADGRIESETGALVS